jgi:RimJ/RimL family protein N-acetyltransferase
VTHGVPPEIIETDRLLLRRPTKSDAGAMFDGWARDLKAVRFLSWKPHTDLSQTEAHIAQCEAAWADATAYVHFLVERASGQVIGSLGSRLDGHGVNFGFVLARPAWGQGFMSEALAPVAAWWLTEGGMYRVWATCHVANVQSVRVLEKAGFTCEATLRRWGLNPNLSDEPYDHLCFSRVRVAS